MSTDKKFTDPRKWAEDVYAVYDHLGIALPDEVATPARRAMHNFAQSGAQNEREFLKTMLPKATDILAKLTKADDDVEIQRLERKSIAELRDYLKNYLSESEECQP